MLLPTGSDSNAVFEKKEAAGELASRRRNCAMGLIKRLHISDATSYPWKHRHGGIDATGFIGLQVDRIKKAPGPYEVRWRNIRIRELK